MSADVASSARRVVLTVGNDLMGDDGAGPLLGALLEEKPVAGWTVVDGGAMPENVTHHVRALKPECVLIVDAAKLELSPGELRFVDKARIGELGLVSTHNLPLSFLMEELERDAGNVVFLGIEPESIGFGLPVSEAVRRAVERVHAGLASGLADVPWLG